jgi:hypothetical protein
MTRIATELSQRNHGDSYMFCSSAKVNLVAMRCYIWINVCEVHSRQIRPGETLCGKRHPFQGITGLISAIANPFVLLNPASSD